MLLIYSKNKNNWLIYVCDSQTEFNSLEAHFRHIKNPKTSNIKGFGDFGLEKRHYILGTRLQSLPF